MAKIGIVGLGLIGGSIFKDLTKLGYDIVGISASQSGVAENIYGDYSALGDCELVFVCKEMSKTLAILDELEQYLSSKTVVCDVCSLKEFVSKIHMTIYTIEPITKSSIIYIVCFVKISFQSCVVPMSVNTTVKRKTNIANKFAQTDNSSISDFPS